MNVDTIVSLSTPPGAGAIAVVRLSGPDSLRVVDRLSEETGSALEPRRATLLRLVDPADGSLIDRSLVTRFVAPESFTGEDMVEISCHGGALTPRLVVEACRAAGARQAEAGEFTRRAYLHGKLDLVQAEAIADLIEARSAAFHRAAILQVERGLSARVGQLREALIGVEALLAHHVDFPEEDDAPVGLDEVIRRTEDVVEAMDAMLATAPEGEMLREGALVVLAGPPNAGKSSLYNALLGEERAIVTELPGTTRDALEASVQIRGYPFRFVDTAGLRDTTERIEAMGIEVAWRHLSRADAVLLCVPHGEVVDADVEDWIARLSDRPVVLLRTKADLSGHDEGVGPEAKAGKDGDGGAIERGTAGDGVSSVVDEIEVSVRSGEGLSALMDALPDVCFSSLVARPDDAPVLTRARQSRALRAARDEVEAFRSGLEEGLPAEVASTHLRSAESALEELLGVVTVDDVLDVVFRDFCIGK